ncbi:MAG: hypothetical protein K8T25_24270 [Planctomycetia bacterium]|nr:hypothetical protein [Planctomycetia bacterium]
MTELSGQRRIELTGDVDYDLARITPLLWPYVGPGVKLTGRGTRSFALSGPLAMPTNALPSSGVVSAALAGQAGVGFDRAELYGLTTSAGELRGDLKQQVVQFAPLSLTVGQGRLMLAPRIDLTSQAVLLHPAQRVAENVELTPEICQAWLKYVAPMLADATRADGKMSIDLSRCSVPLADKAKCDMAGTLLLHTAHVRPGPVAEPLVAMAQQIQMLLQKNPLGTSLGGTAGTNSDVQLNIESQNIQFEVRNGRVSHSPLKIVVGDVEIRTHGSVGFDQTLAILADIPIRQAWIDRNPSLKSLAGQTIQIPVGGTLSKPAIDRRGFDSLARQLGTAAATGALQRGLDGLLKPRK